MHSFRMPSFRFSPNLIEPSNPTLHLDLWDEQTQSFYEHQMNFREAFEFCARLSQEVAAIALRNPELRKRVRVRDIDCDPMEDTVTPVPAEAPTNSYKPRRRVLDRILGRE